MKIICGLGNPGQEYQNHRHNIGFKVVAGVCARLRSSLRALSFQALGFSHVLGEEKVLFLQPQTFMNDSGRPLSEAARFYKTPAENILVIHDELDLPLGKLQVKQGGGSGGHNGLKSIISCLSSDGFARIRFGIGKPLSVQRQDAVLEHVLSDFSSADRKVLPELVDQAGTISEDWAKSGIAWTMNRYNRKTQ